MISFPEFTNKKILIFGLGLNDGGLGMVDFFMAQKAIVTVTDLRTAEVLAPTLAELQQYGNKITYHLGEHRESDFLENDIIVRNPGVKPDNPYLAIARNAGKRIEMEISLFLRLAPCPVACISGTRGKSTTTTLTYLFLKEALGEQVILAGNIGKSAIRELPLLTKDNIVVLELSSFQLDAMRERKESPHISLLTNIYDDHLNWHKDIDDYIDCKNTLFRFQRRGDIAIINIDDPRAKQSIAIPEETEATLITFSSKVSSATYYRNNYHVFERQKELLSLEHSLLDGEHNYQNILGAIALARQYKVSAKLIEKVLATFTGVEGREQLIRTVNGIQIYNNTTATAAEAVVAAFNRFGPRFPKRMIIIAGGMDKGLQYETIRPLFDQYLKALILLEGTASEKIAKVMEGSPVPMYSFYSNLKEAVEKAYALAVAGDMIMLCPSAASFNMFANEFDRGRQFDALVNQLL